MVPTSQDLIVLWISYLPNKQRNQLLPSIYKQKLEESIIVSQSWFCRPVSYGINWINFPSCSVSVQNNNPRNGGCFPSFGICFQLWQWHVVLLVVCVDRDIFHASGCSFLSEGASDLCNIVGGLFFLVFLSQTFNFPGCAHKMATMLQGHQGTQKYPLS